MGIASEESSVDGEDVEVLRLLPFQHQARVAQQNFFVRGRMWKVSELRLRHLLHQRIDIVDAEIITRSRISVQYARSKSDHAHTNRTDLLKRSHRTAHSRIRTVV